MIDQFLFQTLNYSVCCKATNTIIGFQVRNQVNLFEIYQAQFTYDALPQTLKYIVNDTQVLFKYLKNYKQERLNFVVNKNQQNNTVQPQIIINMILGEQIVNKVKLPLKMIEITNEMRYRIESQTLLKNFNKQKQQNEQLKLKFIEIQQKNLKLNEDLEKMMQKFNKAQEQLKNKNDIIDELNIKVRQRQEIIDQLTQSFQIIPFLRTQTTDIIEDYIGEHRKLDGHIKMQKQDKKIEGYYIRKGKKKVKLQDEQPQMQSLRNNKKINPQMQMMETQLQEQSE